MSFSHKVIQSRNHLLFIVTGKDEGSDAWWIVRVFPNKLEAYKRDIKKDSINLPDYGEILHKDWGIEPPADLVKRMQEEYS